VSHVMENYSRSWHRKLERPICWRCRGWMAVLQVDWRKPTGPWQTQKLVHVNLHKQLAWHVWHAVLHVFFLYKFLGPKRMPLYSAQFVQ